MKGIVLVILFLAITPITLFASTLALVSISDTKKLTPEIAVASPQYEAKVYASFDASDFPTVSSEVVAEDARSELVASYLTKNKSPLVTHAKFLVDTADQFGLDYRLLPAIAQKESGLCRVIPENSHNCWGWGIHSKGTLKFENYEEAINTVAKGLKENYIDKGFVTPEQIMKKYAHPDSTTWAAGVSFYMSQLD